VTRERELKLALADTAGLRERLRRVGARPLHEESFEDNVLWDRDGELRASGRLLRLRRDGQGTRLTYKGPPVFDRGVKIREEHETSVADGESVEAILEALGYAPTRRYQKYREEWQLGDVVIALDRTPMGEFVEFEGAAAWAAAERCGCDPASALDADYLALWEGHRGRHPEAPKDMVFPAAQEGDG
jgi:adenylate cyclase class 2